MKKLYQIWILQQGCKSSPHHKKYGGEYNEQTETVAYPFVSFISILPDKYTRDKFISMNYDKLKNFCEYLNEMADANVFYEVRELKYEE